MQKERWTRADDEWTHGRKGHGLSRVNSVTEGQTNK